MNVFPYGQMIVNRNIEENQSQVPIHTSSFDEPLQNSQSTPQLVFKPSITVVGTNSGEIKVEQEEDTNAHQMQTENSSHKPIVFKDHIEEIPTSVVESAPAPAPASVDSALKLTNDIVVVKKA